MSNNSGLYMLDAILSLLATAKVEVPDETLKAILRAGEDRDRDEQGPRP